LANKLRNLHLCVVVATAISTAAVFRELAADALSTAETQALTDRAVPDAGALGALIDAGQNDLWPVAARLAPALVQVRAQLDRRGARFSLMTGSGGGLIGVFDTAQKAAAAARSLADEGFWAHACRVLTNPAKKIEAVHARPQNPKNLSFDPKRP
jgi:4-diphosphocytidyl-2C-methyl-D-erythritol kinase